MTRPAVAARRIAPSPVIPGRLRALVFVAGGSDLGTGLLLLAVPAATLALMRVPAVPAEATIWLRWIGVFVGAVGALYLYPWLGSRERHVDRLRGVVEATALVRAAVAAFVLGAVVLGALAPAWLPVAIFDAAVAALQTAWSRPLRERR